MVCSEAELRAAKKRRRNAGVEERLPASTATKAQRMTLLRFARGESTAASKVCNDAVPALIVVVPMPLRDLAMQRVKEFAGFVQQALHEKPDWVLVARSAKAEALRAYEGFQELAVDSKLRVLLGLAHLISS